MNIWETAKYLLTILIVFVTSVALIATESDVKVVLKKLDRELELRDSYIESRKAKIDSLKNILAKADIESERTMSVLLSIGDEYRAFNTDSAVWFYHSGYTISKSLRLDSIAIRFALRGATYLPLQLRISRAIELMDSVKRAGVPSGLREEYFDAGRQMYSFISDFFSRDSEDFRRYSALATESQKSLLGLNEIHSDIYRLNSGELALSEGEYTAAKIILTEFLEDIDVYNPLYARACHMLADIELAKDNEDGYIYYLALSAISDTKCATLEVTSLQDLGKILFIKGDVERSHDYLSLALKNAVDCNVSLRILQTSQAIPYIEKAHFTEVARSQNRVYIFIGVLAFVLVILMLGVILIKAKNNQLHAMAHTLSEANKTKDLYIAQFLNLCSIYMDKLTQFNKLVNRKISAGKVDDLYKLTKSGRFVEEQSKEFYEVFDDAFLNLYPTFVSEVNDLLLPDKKIVLKEDEKMNADLRILALMRLGIEDTSRIAQMLNYSVFTIYTYRTKLKARAINRDEFEDQIMNIKSFY